jgi:hypothetical protein
MASRSGSQEQFSEAIEAADEEGVAAQNSGSSGIDRVAFRNTSNGKLTRRSVGDRLKHRRVP